MDGRRWCIFPLQWPSSNRWNLKIFSGCLDFKRRKKVTSSFEIEIRMHLWGPCVPEAGKEGPCACKPDCEPTWKDIFAANCEFLLDFMILNVPVTKVWFLSKERRQLHISGFKRKKFGADECFYHIQAYLGARWGVEKRKIAERM